MTNDGTQAISPTLYTELVRDGSKIEQSQFYSTFTGPAVYSDANKYHKIKFEDIAKGKADVPAAADNGWVAMVQHYFASARIPQTGKQHSFYVEAIDANLFRVGIQQPLGQIAPGATVTTDARLFAGPQEERMLEKITPGGTGEGLRLADRAGQADLLAAGEAAWLPRQLGLVDHPADGADCWCSSRCRPRATARWAR